MSIDIVVATDLNGGIGLEGELLYSIKKDMQRFREITDSNFCLLARKTWESLKKPLKNRVNVILTRDESYKINPHLHNEYEIMIEHDVHKIINQYNTGTQTKNLVCCGGAELYREMLPYTDKVYLTKIHDDSKISDSTFPLGYLEQHFKIIHKEEHEENGLKFEFIDYERKM